MTLDGLCNPHLRTICDHLPQRLYRANRNAKSATETTKIFGQGLTFELEIIDFKKWLVILVGRTFRRHFSVKIGWSVFKSDGRLAGLDTQIIQSLSAFWRRHFSKFDGFYCAGKIDLYWPISAFSGLSIFIIKVFLVMWFLRMICHDSESYKWRIS